MYEMLIQFVNKLVCFEVSRSEHVTQIPRFTSAISQLFGINLKTIIMYFKKTLK